MKFGICATPRTANKNAPLKESAVQLEEILHGAGADYFEMNVGSVMGDDFDDLARALAPLTLKPEAFNSFIPTQHRITGPDVDLPSLLEYCRKSLGRCAQLGGQIVVLGSSGARKIPQGFPYERAENQFIEFGQALGPIARDAGVTITVEPLNHREDNFILDMKQGMHMVDAIYHPNVQLLADLYHITEDNEDLKNVGDSGTRLRHTHVADLGRVPPGFAKNGEAEFREFYRQCRRAGHVARTSYEGSFSDFTAQVAPLITRLKLRWTESAMP